MEASDKIKNKKILAYSKKFGRGTAGKTVSKSIATDSGFLPLRSDMELLWSAQNCWHSLDSWRRDIMRNEEFVFGDQFSDIVWDYKTKTSMTERRLIQLQGHNPQQYNIIRNILRTVVGVWSINDTLPTCIAQKDENQYESEVLSSTLQALYRKNELKKFHISQLLQLLITGVALSENIFTNRESDRDIFCDFINPFSFFVDNSMRDPRYTDCSLVGYFVDLPLKVIAGAFSKGNKARAERVRAVYGSSRESTEHRIHEISETFTEQRVDFDFFMPGVASRGLHRVFKIFRKESAACYWVHDYYNGTYYPDFESTEAALRAENERRIAEQSALGVSDDDMLLLDYEYGTSEYWKYYFLSPYGDVLDEGKVKDWHEKPSIVFEFHDFFIGKIYPFVKDLIDTQKQVNQLSAISALLTKFSAKSLMFVASESIDEESGGIEQIRHESTGYDAVIQYKSYNEKTKTQNPQPTYHNTIADAFTPLNVVNMYLRLSENISGVFGALQGAQPPSGTPAQMYAQQSQNSATSLVGVFEAMQSFKQRNAKMMVQLMQQYYTEKRYVFCQSTGERVLWDPEKVRNIEFEVSITENTNTPAYRLMINDILMQLKQFDTQNQLDLRGLIEVGNFPFKEKLVQYLNTREQEMEQAAQAGGSLSPMPDDLQRDLSNYQFSPQVLEAFHNQPPNIQQAILEQVQGG